MQFPLSVERYELGADPNWYQSAVFYELNVRGFHDTNGDGTGEIRGVIERLDYLQWLGVDCVWLLPFFPSPLKDGGYDVSDFFTVLPAFGVIEDIKDLIDGCHARGMRLIADMVMNHTSDTHPWFIESRSSRDNPKADWYVWNDDDQLYKDARVIFLDTETSNWEWDDQRQQYYWHRFFHHQPDLNYENPEVQEAMLGVMRFWMDLGLDGFRLDAVTYLVERDGTSCDNLPETHEFLKRVRGVVDAEYSDRVLLAEANLVPTELIDYFGDGDECHMCFHFPLMPRMFLAVRRADRTPITQAIEMTPEIPANCQWGLFLRNHDELTLEMVDEAERAFMHAEFAGDPRSIRNLGIARRLFPLINNDRSIAELLHALLFSLPGSPVLYYGDEIGMGDNVELADRDSVRTPMQWTPDRHGGFSMADTAELYLPPLIDPIYGYEARNVQDQFVDHTSFLHWMQRMIHLRREHPVFGTGDFAVVPCENLAIFAYLRRSKGERSDTPPSRNDTMLCVANLSDLDQHATLHIEGFAEVTPYDVITETAAAPIGAAHWDVQLPAYGFAWFDLTRSQRATTGLP